MVSHFTSCMKGAPAKALMVDLEKRGLRLEVDSLGGPIPSGRFANILDNETTHLRTYNQIFL